MTMKQIGFRLKPSTEAEALGRTPQSLGQEGTAQTLSRPRLRGAGLRSPRRGRGPLCAVGDASLKRDGWKPLPFAWSFLFASSIQVPVSVKMRVHAAYADGKLARLSPTSAKVLPIYH